MAVTREQVLDKLSRDLALRFNEIYGGNPEYLRRLQKTITGGRIQATGGTGRTDDQRMVLYGSDDAISVVEDSLDYIDMLFKDGDGNYNLNFRIDDTITPAEFDESGNIISYPGITLTQLWSGGSQHPIDDPNGGPRLSDNIAQLITVKQLTTNIDPSKAKEVLTDRTIYELLPQERTRMDRIQDFYLEFNELIGNPPDNFDEEEPLGVVDDTWYIDGGASDLFHQQYDLTGQPNYENIDDDASYYIPRLEEDQGEDLGVSIQGMRDTLDQYLEDVDQGIGDTRDSRPEYKNVSSGYLKIRNLNQSVIIRNLESDDMGFGTVDNPVWQDTGFTITMWVKFLDKVSSGTLFNLGNPLRTAGTPYGFMLETYVVKSVEDDSGNASYITPGYYDNPDNGAWEFLPNWGFTDSDTERFIRLVVRDGDGKLRDSHLPIPAVERPIAGSPALRADTGDLGNTSMEIGQGRTWTYTRVPVDLQEWYFIVATYSPWDGTNGINEDGSFGVTHDTCNNDNCDEDPDFWRWNIDESGYISNSGFGAQCKVEIISRSDLLRARGYKT